MIAPLLFAPIPKKVAYRSGTHSFGPDSKIVIRPEEKESIYPVAKRAQDIVGTYSSRALQITLAEGNEGSQLRFLRDSSLAADGYRLVIDGSGITLEYASPVGAFYAVSTLKQIAIQTGNDLPFVPTQDIRACDRPRGN